MLALRNEYLIYCLIYSCIFELEVEQIKKGDCNDVFLTHVVCDHENCYFSSPFIFVLNLLTETQMFLFKNRTENGFFFR